MRGWGEKDASYLTIATIVSPPQLIAPRSINPNSPPAAAAAHPPSALCVLSTRTAQYEPSPVADQECTPVRRDCNLTSGLSFGIAWLVFFSALVDGR
ncbi:Hypothetical protein NTJ_01706 [Nesidiocoris tenuis]|uniref:Uncharacterized protein n=1 Tax=Nesidiocoris tenuis TaxID=355587 RepID=A0ABN7A9B1_9HEMI|nr:Hypothetical protein NTJ_01706 [Nesidiocoris tenuis]